MADGRGVQQPRARRGKLTPVRPLMMRLERHLRPRARDDLRIVVRTKLEITRTAIDPITKYVIALPNLEALAATIREIDHAKSLRARFGKRFATEDLSSFDFVWTSVL